MKRISKKAILTLFAIILISNITYSEIIIDSTNTQDIIITTSENFQVYTYGTANDFLLSSQNNMINICACETYTDIITLQNTGIFTETYTITFDPDFSKTQDMEITLFPGEKTSIPNYIDTGCKESSEEMRTIIESSSGKTKILTQQINSNICNNINIINLKQDKNTTPCKKAYTTFTLENPLSFKEEYTIETENYDTIQNLSAIAFTLEGKTRKNITVEHLTPCKDYGNYKSSITILTTNTELVAEIPININITKKYDYSLSVKDNTYVCSADDERIPVTLKNIEKFENEITLTLSKNDKFSLTDKTVKLGSNEEKTVYLISKSDKIGEYSLELNAKSKLGDVEKKINFDTKSNDCYKFEVLETSKEICEDDELTTFKIQNLGTKKSEFKIETINNQTIWYTPKTFALNPNEEKKITVGIVKNSGSENIKLKVFQNNHPYTIKLELNKIKQKDCYSLKFDMLSKLENITSLQKIKLINNGVKNANYKLSIEPENNIKFIEDSLFIESNSNKTTFLSINTKKIQENTELTLYAKVDGTNVTYKKKIEIIIKKESLISKIDRILFPVTSFIKSNIARIILSAIIIGIIILLTISALMIAMLVKRRNDKRKKLVVMFHKKKIR